MDEGTRLHGIGLMVGVVMGMAMFSSFTSSPWTMENVGADPAHASSARRLVGYAVGASVLVGAGAALLDKNRWEAVGAIGSAAFMWWLYDDALKKASAKGYTGLNMGMSGSQSP